MKTPCRLRLSAYISVVLLALGTPSAIAQCTDPGLKKGGYLDIEGRYGTNGTGKMETLLPRDAINLDTSFHQPSLKQYGGGSDTKSPLQPSQIPAGICIVASGTEDHNKGWAV